MIFNMMGSLVKKDAEWIPLNTGAQTMAPPPSNWTSYSFTVDRVPQCVAIKGYYGGHETYGFITPLYVPNGGGAIRTYSIYALSDEQFRNLSIVSGPTVGDLSSGSKVKLGSFDGSPLIWIVARDTALNNALRLVLSGDDTIRLGNHHFDMAEPTNDDTNIQMYGCPDYSVSNIRQWINSNGIAGSWFTAQSATDVAPDYANENGFLYEWTETELSFLQDMTLDSIESDGKYFEQTVQNTDKVALMSLSEIYGSDGVGSLDIFPDNESRIIDPETYARILWLRDVYGDVHMHSVYTINAYGRHGDVDSHVPYDSTRTVFYPRVMISPVSTMPLNSTLDSDGCYTIRTDETQTALSAPITFTIEFNGSPYDCAYCPIHNPE